MGPNITEALMREALVNTVFGVAFTEAKLFRDEAPGSRFSEVENREKLETLIVQILDSPEDVDSMDLMPIGRDKSVRRAELKLKSPQIANKVMNGLRNQRIGDCELKASPQYMKKYILKTPAYQACRTYYKKIVEEILKEYPDGVEFENSYEDQEIKEKLKKRGEYSDQIVHIKLKCQQIF
jgi:hypothetical protein